MANGLESISLGRIEESRHYAALQLSAIIEIFHIGYYRFA
jgi:hypothetical protein